MVGPELLNAALEKPKEVGEGLEKTGEGVEHAATGIGTGTGKIVVSVGTSVGTAADGMGKGSRESKLGDAEKTRAQGDADAARIKAEADHIKAMAELAAQIKDLPPETQQAILNKVSAPTEQAQQQPAPIVRAVQVMATGSVLRAFAHPPGTSITSQQNHGPLLLTLLGQGNTLA